MILDIFHLLDYLEFLRHTELVSFSSRPKIMKLLSNIWDRSMLHQ